MSYYKWLNINVRKCNKLSEHKSVSEYFHIFHKLLGGELSMREVFFELLVLDT